MERGDIVVYKGRIGKIVTEGFISPVMKFLPCNYGRYSYSELETITEGNVREATHDEKLVLIEEEYKWGEVKKIHCIGEYQIVEAVKDDKTFYEGYLNYKPTHVMYESLDSAIIGCIATKYEGANGKAAEYFAKMIGME